MAKHGNLSLGDLSPETIRAICIDFVVHEIRPVALQKKHNISESAFYYIRDRLNLIDKQNKYRQKVLDKALSKLATRQSQIIVKTVKIMNKWVDRVDRLQNILDGGLSSEMINDIMKIYSLLQKEKRLDEDKPTDNLNIKVKVELDDSIPILGHTVIEEAQIVQKEEIKKIEEPLRDNIEDINKKVEDDVMVILDEDTIGTSL